MKLLEQMEHALDRCMRRDQHALRQAIKRLRKAALQREEQALQADARWQADLKRLQERFDASRQTLASRAATLPDISYPGDLPVTERRDEIREAIERHQVVVVCGETGSGKTTQLPKICIEAGRGLRGVIGHTQPRRIAARSVAVRIAEELEQPLGQSVGYKVRFHDQTRPETLIKLMTDGILLAEIQHDRYLDQYDTLIIDEAHERSLNIDFLLGYLKWLLPRRPDFKLVITSATIDPERFARHFDGAPVINVSGRTYPVEVRYRPVSMDEEADETDGREQQAILDAVDELHREIPQGDILIFLSGEREIRETAESLRKHHPRGLEILPLYSRLATQEQDRIFRPRAQRRVVLATNVAETSLTVPGIRAVIDTGHARISRYSHRSRLQRLPIEKISQASAQQRAGRCGRIGPGICIRLYAEDDFLRRDEFTDPEILRTHLAAVILQMKQLGLGDIRHFPFVEAPDERLVRDGSKTLQELNALDADGNMTALGKQLAQLPVDPRLGRMLLAAQKENCIAEVMVIVAALSIQDPRERPQEHAQAADQKHARFRHEESDFMALLNLWRHLEDERRHMSNARFRNYCRESFLSYLRIREWHDVHQQLLDVVKGSLAIRVNEVPAEYAEIHKALLSGLLAHVGFRQDRHEYVGVRGQKFQIFPGSYLFKSRPVWIMSSEQVETSKVYARTVARLDPQWIESVGAHLIRLQHFDPHWERKAGRAAILERSTLFALTIQSGRKRPLEQIDAPLARELFIRHALVMMDYDSKAPFFLHNQRLLAETDYQQHKERRADLLIDEEGLYRFFDERIPPEVVSSVTFEKWRRKIERETPDHLQLTREAILMTGPEQHGNSQFPDDFQLGPLRFRLEYRFDPGHEDDGVTAIIPLHMLNQVDSEAFRWLVPGLFAEKLVAMIRALPKTYRIHFVPAPDYAQRVLPMLDQARASEGLAQQLGQALKRLGGVAPPVAAFDESLLPRHLRMNFAVIDAHDVVLARSRDLAALQQSLGRQAGENFAAMAHQEMALTGRSTWDFEDLPVFYDRVSEGQRLYGYPAVYDEGETVGVRVFDLEEQAHVQHELGMMRLFRLALSKEMRYLRRNLALDAAVQLAYSQ